MGNELITLTLERYTIYKNDRYYLCISNDIVDNYQLYIGFSPIELDYLSKDELVTEIRKISDLVMAKSNNNVYILPIISPSILEQVANENDDRSYAKFMKQVIQPITSDIYNKFVSKKKKVNQMINMIKQNDSERKFIWWLSIKLGNKFIKEVEYSSLIRKEIIKEENKKVVIQDYGYEIDAPKDKDLNKIKDKNIKKSSVSYGFSNIFFIIMVLTISLGIGIGFCYLLIK